MGEKAIESLSKFIEKIENLEKPKDGYQRFYRGQNVDLPLIPAVFRSESLTKNESEIYHEIVNKKPEEFENCKCSFDYLVKMQHYNIPTRLLDITSNPLVALFFACSGCKKGGSPTVYCIDIPKHSLKNYTSDNVTILSALARCEQEVQDQVYNVVVEKQEQELNIILKENIHLAIMDFLESSDKDKTLDKVKFTAAILKKIPQNNAYLLKNKILYYKDLSINIEHLLNEFIWFYKKAKGIKNHSSKAWNYALYRHSKIIHNSYLLHEIKQDKPYFQDIMNVKTFNNIFCVTPKLDNPRLIRQSGAFLLFPRKGKVLDTGDSDKILIIKILIDKSSAKNISKNLEKLNINEEYLYADMDTVSKSIKNKYLKMKI